MDVTHKYFIDFKDSLDGIALPEKFTFPFFYDPHPLAERAAEQLQQHLKSQSEWTHNFGLDPDKKEGAIGKMFGVLVVQDTTGKIGFLAGYSGKIADSNHLPYFVPPVYDTLDKEGFYKQGERMLNQYTATINKLESAPEFIRAKEYLDRVVEETNASIVERRLLNKANKKDRKRKRAELGAQMNEGDFKVVLDSLGKESVRDSYVLKDLIRDSENRVQQAEHEVNVYKDEIKKIREKRKALSSQLQKQLHQNYQFLNAKGETQDLLDLFKDSFHKVPPAGSGECAAPKLLQYAYLNKLHPIALAEFWWGTSPNTEIRNHKHYYPACRGKCLPILTHMLVGLDVDDNPLLETPPLLKEIEILYEDDHIAILNKPHEFLSVPGRNISDSVLTRMKEKYPDATGPLLVHRLDMSTSGILVLAKDMRSHRILQQQFIKKTIQKEYTAILNGTLKSDSGIIDLPLRVDLDDRPRQMVCYEHGKPAQTRYQVLDRTKSKTRISFFPVTGRTHQLRVHAAHTKGLSIPIVGDDLYGTKQDRLHLHATWIKLIHPETRKTMKFHCPAPF